MFSFLANISEQKKQRYLIFIFFFILLATFIILRELYKKPKISSFAPAPQYKEVKIDFKILENPLFQMLRPFETISPFPNVPGRKNPFLPF